MEQWYLTAGDFGYYWAGQIKSFSWLPQVFRNDMGFGWSQLTILWFEYPYRLLLKIMDSIGLSWWAIEKLVWLSVLVVAIYSSYRLARFVLGKNQFALLAPVIYVTNTYFLLLLSGRQLGVAWAYAFSPWVLTKFIEAIDVQKTFKVRRTVTNGLVFALLVALDLRIAYLVFGAIMLYAFIKLIRDRFFPRSVYYTLLYTLVLPLGIAMTVHLFWILPTVLASRGVAELGEQFTSPGMLKFLSFADFSHALSLLHPNWPENLFGKVYFLQPEFLLFPVLAFSSLLFTKRDRTITFFALLSIIGIFFAKGVNDPFGGLFQWMFIHVPGFVMFRDPTKFYLYIAIAYSALVPYTFKRITDHVSDTKRNILILLFAALWVFTVRAVFTGQVISNFLPVQLPKEYVELKDLLVSDPKPSRTLWIPTQENFVYSSDVHPYLTADQLFNSASLSAMIHIIHTPFFEQTLATSGVKYVIVPEDVGKRMFLTDYRFDPILRNELVAALDTTTLTKEPGFHDVAVYENNIFTMHTDVPAEVTSQQKLANIGAMISAVFIAGWIIALKFL